MITTRALLSLLGNFADDLGQDQFRPQQKWLRDVLYGILTNRSLMLSEIGRALDEPYDLIQTEKRLSRNLNSDRLDDALLLKRHYDRVATDFRRDDGEGVVIAVDYTDIHKPRAQLEGGMEGVTECWNGSEHTVTKGFPVVQLEGHLPGGRRRPLLYRPFTWPARSKAQRLKGEKKPRKKRTDPSPQTEAFTAAFRETAEYVGPKAIWALDRGFDLRPYLDTLDEVGARWVVRLKTGKNSRELVRETGPAKQVSKLAPIAPYRYSMTKRPTRRKKALRLRLHVERVWFPDAWGGKDGPERTLITVWGIGATPLVMLASEALRDRSGVVERVNAYFRRWQAEEANRAMKDSRGWGVRLEDVRALKFRGVQRMVLLAMLAYSYVSELRSLAERGATEVAKAVKAFGSSPTDTTYRLVRGLGRLLVRVPGRDLRRWRLAVGIPPSST